jgi:hypothetical protein
MVNIGHTQLHTCRGRLGPIGGTTRSFWGTAMICVSQAGRADRGTQHPYPARWTDGTVMFNLDPEVTVYAQRAKKSNTVQNRPDNFFMEI